MGYDGSYKSLGLDKESIILILKCMVNKLMLPDSGMDSNQNSKIDSKNFKTIFPPTSSDRHEFISRYRAKSYISDTSKEKIIDFERKLRAKILSKDELEKDMEINFPRRDNSSLPFSNRDKQQRWRDRNFNEPAQAQMVTLSKPIREEPLSYQTSFIQEKPEIEKVQSRSVERSFGEIEFPRVVKRGFENRGFTDNTNVERETKLSKSRARPQRKKSESSKSSESEDSSESSKRPRKKRDRERSRKARKASKSRSNKKHSKRKRETSSSSSSSSSTSKSDSSESEKDTKQKNESPKKRGRSESSSKEVLFETSGRRDDSDDRKKKRKRSRSKSNHKKNSKKRRRGAKKSSSKSSSSKSKGGAESRNSKSRRRRKARSKHRGSRRKSRANSSKYYKK